MRKSVVLLVLLSLFIIDCGIKFVKPLRYVEMGGYVPMDQDPVSDKFDILKTQLGKTEVLLLGSSLPMFAAICADYRVGKTTLPTIDYDLLTYTRAQYFEGLLRDAGKRNLHVFNFSGGGCMASDDYILLELAVRQGLRPKIAILALAPRDFVDNIARPTEKTAYYDFFNKLESKIIPADSEMFNIEDSGNKLLANLWYYYNIKSDYRTLLTLACTSLFQHEASLYAATHRGSPQQEYTQVRFALWERRLADFTGNEKYKQACLERYRNSYTPVDLTRFSAESNYLYKTLKFCRDHGILPVVVNMPLTARNRALMSPWFREKYMNVLTEACAKYDCPFFDLNDDELFGENDFRDSVHVNGSGGLKIFDSLTKKLCSNRQFLEAVDDEGRLSMWQ